MELLQRQMVQVPSNLCVYARLTLAFHVARCVFCVSMSVCGCVSVCAEHVIIRCSHRNRYGGPRWRGRQERQQPELSDLLMGAKQASRNVLSFYINIKLFCFLIFKLLFKLQNQVKGSLTQLTLLLSSSPKESTLNHLTIMTQVSVGKIKCLFLTHIMLKCA